MDTQTKVRLTWVNLYLETNDAGYITQRKKPPKIRRLCSYDSKFTRMLRAQHDKEAGPQVMWIGMQRMRDFAMPWDILPGLRV